MRFKVQQIGFIIHSLYLASIQLIQYSNFQPVSPILYSLFILRATDDLPPCKICDDLEI